MGTRELILSTNPATEEVLYTYSPHSEPQIDKALEMAGTAFKRWKSTSLRERGKLLENAAAILRREKARLAAIITAEMGKPIIESEAEVEKCAWNCEYYAENAESFLSRQKRASSAAESYVQFTPLGTILAIMPWNFPFWQVFRFAAPGLMAGNTAILKHASNVPQCGQEIEEVFRRAGFPPGVFCNLLVPGSATSRLIEDRRVAAVTLTGSEEAGIAVASASGRTLKKTVLELGGSDPFIILEDADLPEAVRTGVRARYQNAGQSCIAAKRFIVVDSMYDKCLQMFGEAVQGLKVGDPFDRATQIGPLARPDLRDALENQVRGSVHLGAKLILGGNRRPGRGYYFEPTVLSDVQEGMPAAREEVFGPVAALMRVPDDREAIRLANASGFGLGASLWTADLNRARALAGEIEAGQVFINGMVASDPRLPFGGIKRSGYGRELSEFGIREFVNIQTVWIGPHNAGR